MTINIFSNKFKLEKNLKSRIYKYKFVLDLAINAFPIQIMRIWIFCACLSFERSMETEARTDDRRLMNLNNKEFDCAQRSSLALLVSIFFRRLRTQNISYQHCSKNIHCCFCYYVKKELEKNAASKGYLIRYDCICSSTIRQRHTHESKESLRHTQELVRKREKKHNEYEIEYGRVLSTQSFLWRTGVQIYLFKVLNDSSNKLSMFFWAHYCL